MRQIACIVILCLLLALPAAAFSGISSAQNQTIVSTEGDCDVTLTLILELDSTPAALVFPLPANAASVTVNGSSVSTVYSGSTRNVDLSGFVTGPGTYTMIIRYRLTGAVAYEGEDLILTLELLSGFDHPVDSLGFSITLPGAVEARPSFTSTYYQDTIETMMTVTQNGELITGAMDQRLQDHETLTMTLKVTEEMFPQPDQDPFSIGTVELLMLGFALLALLYWLCAMRCAPPRRLRRTAPPEGVTAGSLGCCLTGEGVDFTMMVVSWAQMGYLLIQPDDNGRILLHKRMEMGNERSDFENRCFRMLFGKRQVVDGTGYHYAELCRKAARSIPGARDNFCRNSGNPRVFRVLALAVGTLSGISLAMAFASDPGWQTVLAIVLGVAGTAAAWLMQSAAGALHSRHKLRLWLALAAVAVWYLLGQAAGAWGQAVCVIVLQLLAGLAAAYGGKRTPSGRQVMGEILGLRHYLKHLSGEELKRILRSNPHYYYDLAPYALALGVDKSFTRHLRSARLPQCPYLTTGMDGHLTVSEWDELLRDTVAGLDAMQQRLPLDRLMGK